MVNPNRIAQYTPDETPVPFATTPDERAATAARETARRQVSRGSTYAEATNPDRPYLNGLTKRQYDDSVAAGQIAEPVHFDNDGITQSIDERSAPYIWYESARWDMDGRDSGTTLGGLYAFVKGRRDAGYDTSLLPDELDDSRLVLWLRKRLPGETV